MLRRWFLFMGLMSASDRGAVFQVKSPCHFESSSSNKKKYLNMRLSPKHFTFKKNSLISNMARPCIHVGQNLPPPNYKVRGVILPYSCGRPMGMRKYEAHCPTLWTKRCTAWLCFSVGNINIKAYLLLRGRMGGHFQNRYYPIFIQS